MTGYVVDASVAVKWLVAEPLSHDAAKLLDLDVTLVAPDLLFAEATSALVAKHRRGEIDLEELAQAVDLLRVAPVGTPLSMRQLAASSARLAADLRHSIYDCVYLALAIHEAYPVVTADTHFHGKVRRHPYLADRVLHVADIPAPPNWRAAPP